MDIHAYTTALAHFGLEQIKHFYPLENSTSEGRKFSPPLGRNTQERQVGPIASRQNGVATMCTGSAAIMSGFWFLDFPLLWEWNILFLPMPPGDNNSYTSHRIKWLHKFFKMLTIVFATSWMLNESLLFLYILLLTILYGASSNFG